MRKPGGFDGEKIRTEANYLNVRKNASEFGCCSKFGGKLRRALQPFVKELNDPVLHGRMAKMLHEIMKLDLESPKGERTVGKGLQHAESRKILQNFVWNPADGKRCRYSFDERRLFFDRLPVGSTKAAVTLRFIRPEETQESLHFVDVDLEVHLPCSEYRIPEDERFEAVGEGNLKFALIRFFDKNGFVLSGKTSVAVG